MKESSVNTLFQLLRSALGSQSAEGLPADIDWQEVDERVLGHVAEERWHLDA